MQPYRHIRPHDPTSCWLCAPDKPGHQACQHDGCGEIAEVQHRRHATDAEYAAIPEGLRPIDQVAHMAVFTCGDHEPDPICGPEHHGITTVEQQNLLAAECPRCGASAGESCTKAFGGVRSTVHKDRVPPPASLPDACNHVHRAACEGLGACQCQPDDPIPDRPTRALVPLA